MRRTFVPEVALRERSVCRCDLTAWTFDGEKTTRPRNQTVPNLDIWTVVFAARGSRLEAATGTG